MMEKFYKTATLTFHASHNYGSMLQAYALQNVMLRIFGHNTILNLRTIRQRNMMKSIGFSKNPRSWIKSLLAYYYLPSLKQKWQLFEDFIESNLILDNDYGYEVISPEILSDYDIIFTGSDQIWNPNPVDFDKAYYLPFRTSAKKISYAASMGPKALIDGAIASKIGSALMDYDKISVRELGTKNKVEQLSGRRDVSINCDPVLLLSREDWIKFINPNNPEKTDYILLYSLFSDKLVVDVAERLSLELNIPVIITSFTNSYAIFSKFKKRLNAGPIEFLNYLYHAMAVVTSSFHGTAFSILFNKPFYAINGMEDNRISTLLKGCSLQAQSISSESEIDSSKLFKIDFTDAKKWIEEQRQNGITFIESVKS